MNDQNANQNTNPNIPEQVRAILEQQEINMMDDLVDSFSYNTALVWKPKQHYKNHHMTMTAILLPVKITMNF